jgi:hypothetical protein
MSNGDWLIAWSIRWAMLAFFVVLAWLVSRPSGQALNFNWKLVWTAGFLLSVLHVLAAFHFVHHWSHREALLATAVETQQKLGFDYGIGVYFNYLFLAVWGLDILYAWCPVKWSSKFVERLVMAGRCYLLFIAFNSLVVFESGWLRIFGAVASALILGIAMVFRRGKSASLMS